MSCYILCLVYFWYTSACSSIYLQWILNFWSLKWLESTSTSLRTVGSKPHGKSKVSRSTRLNFDLTPPMILPFCLFSVGISHFLTESPLWLAWTICKDGKFSLKSPLLHSEIRTSMILLTNGFWASRTRWQVYNEVGSMGVNAGNFWENVKDALFLTALPL